MTYNLLAYLLFLDMEYKIFNYGPSGSSRVINFCLLVVGHQLLHIPIHFSQSAMPEELAEEDGIGLFLPYSTPTLTKYYH
jgi:hypothetical protein